MNADKDKIYDDGTLAAGMSAGDSAEVRNAVLIIEKRLKRQRIRGVIIRNVPTVICFLAGAGISAFVQHLQ